MFKHLMRPRCCLAHLSLLSESSALHTQEDTQTLVYALTSTPYTLKHASLKCGNTHTHTHLHNLLTLTKTYIWQTASRRVGQLAGNKLDPWVPHCSVGLKAILKASPTVVQQWESMDSGQGKQPGASHAPGGQHLLSLCTVAPLCSA